MIFQFELMNIDGVRSGNWEKRAIPLTELKENIVKWQTDLFNSGWSGQFLGSHDFPRIVSRFGNDSAKYRVLSAKMLASFLFGLQGTPYIYQGDEIGMTNYPWRSIHDFRDVESLNVFKKLIAKGLDPKEALKRLSDSSRDNARTPMQWSAGKNAGFSDHDPWIAVNPNYLQVNADNNGKDQEPIFDYYKKLIMLRKQNAVFNDGNFKLLLPEQKNIFAYKRSNADDEIVVLTNFSAEEIDLGNDYPALKTSRIILSNYHDRYSSAHHNAIIRPYEALWIRQ
ncbi:glucan 1,6-alpha-glucosidase [Oenococcus sicerae]|nr:glucan 1,6-alpha-glucosidase [Oenococcus sicerae]